MTVRDERPVIAFSKWGAGPVGKYGGLVIATAASSTPASQNAWQFHLLHPGLYVASNDNGDEGQIVMFPVGAGLGLVAQHSAVHSEGDQAIVAWCPGLPQKTADWVVSPTGINSHASAGQVAGAGTAEFIAEAQVPNFGYLYPEQVHGVYLAVAKLPLTGRYSEWTAACVQMDNFPGLEGTAAAPASCSTRRVSLAACEGSLYMACDATVMKFNQLGFLIRQKAIVVGQCKTPLADPSRWEFTIIDTIPFQFDNCLIRTDGKRLYVVYAKDWELHLAECALTDTMNQDAWSIKPIVQRGIKQSCAIIDNKFAFVYYSMSNYDYNSSVYYSILNSSSAGRDPLTCLVPGVTEYLSLGEIAGHPVLSSYSWNGSLQYAWSEQSQPREPSAWHHSIVYAESPKADRSAQQQAAEEDKWRFDIDHAFPPVPDSHQAEVLAAGALLLPPSYKLTWLAALLALAIVALAAWGARWMWHRRLAG
jgi:hypothetical protein